MNSKILLAILVGTVSCPLLGGAPPVRQRKETMPSFITRQKAWRAKQTGKPAARVAGAKPDVGVLQGLDQQADTLIQNVNKLKGEIKGAIHTAQRS